jgi:aryl-phospho-beta-D-glucosidase BglC (GH1 family)
MLRSLLIALALVPAAMPATAAPAPLAEPTPEQLPRWRGFNLLEKFQFRGEPRPFLEEDFRLIAELGFNFVRLPMDYRGWIRDGDWEQFNETALRQIDEAVAWGGRHGLHVCLNFHRAPGYTVAQPPEARDLWTDAEAQRVCALHWAAFARRYREVPNARLSFNLLNEPANVDRAAFLAVTRRLVDAIRAEHPERLIICDGPQWGRDPVAELRDLKVASATRGYTPMEISHYGASWVASEHFPPPEWPRRFGSNGLLHGAWKRDLSRPLVIEGPFERPTTLRMRVGIVSAKAQLEVQAGDAVIFERLFVCGPGEGEWRKADYKEAWQTWQNLYDRDCTATIPAGTPRVSIRVGDGDWLSLREIGLAEGSAESVLALDSQYGEPPGPLGWRDGRLAGAVLQDGAWLMEHTVAPWRRLASSGVGVMVGEWGAFNRTPHDVTLRWAEDCLRNWREAGFGWALWNFRGPFGILDSGRADVRYDEFHGHQLDRKLLDLLRKY